MRYLLIIIAFTLLSCGQGYHARRIEHHTAKFMKRGGKVSTDSLYKNLAVKFPALNIKFETKIVSRGTKVLIFEKDSAEVKLNFSEDKKGNQTVKPEVKCPERIKYVKVPYAVKQEFKCEGQMRWWQLTLIILGVAVIGLGVGYFFGKFS